MKSFFRLASFVFILSVFLTQHAFAQQPLPPRVLFETWTNSNEPCPDPARAPFETAAFEGSSSTASTDASKIVTINYHVGNLADQLSVLDNGGGTVDGRLTGSQTYIYMAAVNRSTFPQTGQRIDPPTTGSGSYSDWGTQIGMDYTPTPEASITLNNATLDKTDSGSYYKLFLDLTVTANTQINDSLIIRYAITQDVSWAECNTKATVLNDVAMYVSTSNASSYIVCLPTPGMNAGATAHMTATITIDHGDTSLEHIANMKAIAFLEDDGGGDYNVVDAVVLRNNLDTLQPPPPTLAITNSGIDGKIYNPGSVATIPYYFTNLVGGVNAYYSLDNGTTWRYIATNPSPNSYSIDWTVPDSVTTQGKFKLVGVNYPSLVSIQDGNFTIANAASVTILKPQPAQVIVGGSSDTIVWTRNGIDSVTLQYYIAEANGDFATAVVLGRNLTDTSFVWTVPDTGRLGPVEIQLLPVNNEAPAYSVVDTIEGKTIIQNSVASSSQPTGLSITNIFPNPASNGQEIVVQYAESVAKPITVQLLDLLGRVMPESSTTDNQAVHLNTNALTAGAYVVRLSDGTNTVSKRVEIIR